MKSFLLCNDRRKSKNKYYKNDNELGFPTFFEKLSSFMYEILIQLVVNVSFIALPIFYLAGIYTTMTKFANEQ